MAAIESINKWLYEIRKLCARKRDILNDIDNVKQERETIFDAANTVYGNVGGHTSDINDPTLQKAQKLCDKYKNKLDGLILEMENIIDNIDKRHEIITACFEDEEADMTVQEYETLFYYYFEGMSADEVGTAIYYSERKIYEFKKGAINKLNMYIKKHKNELLQ
jgi:uncharacterized coiled-coil DUF342 family protein